MLMLLLPPDDPELWMKFSTPGDDDAATPFFIR